ncbi:NRAMP family divalent metal transporter [Rothia santali]
MSDREPPAGAVPSATPSDAPGASGTASGPADSTARATFVKARRGSLLGAIFLMATSAIGPGFITQTAVFTQALGAAFAFGILASIVIDFVVQANIWRIVTVSGKRAAELANAAIPCSGYVLAALVVFGGLVFNIGNIAGAALGLNALLGLDPKVGGALSALLAIAIFLVRRAGMLMDRALVGLGLLMIVLTAVVAVLADPPVGEALRQTVLPDTVDFAMITTIVGGTVGGYITYAGAHKLLDAGVSGPEHVREVTRSAFFGIGVTGVMRFVLFLAFLGVVASGVTLDVAGNPAGDAFAAAAGELGMRLFGLVLWAAGISSVIGAAFTSVSFTSVFSARIEGRVRNWTTVGFIAVGTVSYLALGTAPAALLVFAGGFNGLILPIGFTVFMYVAWFRRDLLNGYRVPLWLRVAGVLVTVMSWYMGAVSFTAIFDFLAA